MQSCHIAVAVRLKTRMNKTPETEISNPWRVCLRRRASSEHIQRNRTDCLYDISQSGGQVRHGKASTSYWRVSNVRRFTIIGPSGWRLGVLLSSDTFGSTR